VFCVQWLFGAGFGGRTLHHLERSWKVVEVLPLYRGTIPHGWSAGYLGLESLEPYWCLLRCFVWFCAVWCCLGLDLVGGPTPPPGTVLEGGGGRKWNYSSPRLAFPLGSGVTGTMWCLLEHFVWFVCSGVVWGWVVGPTPPGTALEVWRSLLPNGTFHLVWSTFPLGSGPTGTILPVGSLCVVCVQWCCLGLDLVVGPLHHLERSWSGGGHSPCTKWNFLMVGQPFHLGLESWNHIGACWILCVVFVQWYCCWEAGSGGRTHHLERSWKVVEVLSLYQMELPIMVGQPFHLGLVPGTMWCLLEHFVWFLCSVCYLGLDLVVGPTPPPGTGWKVVEVLTCTKWNYSSWLFTIALGSGPWNHVGACWITLCGFVCSGVVWGWISGRTPLHHLERSWKVVEVLLL
jgi:hypothetical protein